MASSLGKIVAFIFKFDQAKMFQPGVQNDFSGYRRVLGKTDPSLSLPMDEARASMVSMWVAQAAPFSNDCAVALKSIKPPGNLAVSLRVLADLANACCGMVDLGKCSSGTTSLCMSIMVGCIILYDCSTNQNGGAFTSRDLAIRKCIMCAKKKGGDNSHINAIKYSTFHFKEAPNRIQSMLE
eukprot:FR743453.1.p1 GENE.FR743453.1~~FR743453.1.p1  ORF type:complete len:193 (+),score=25.39 FR743453.1:34-579(+)